MKTLRFADLDPHALLVQECENDYCGHVTLHGFPSRLKWIWAIPSVSVRPACGCDRCGEPWRVEFTVEVTERAVVS